MQLKIKKKKIGFFLVFCYIILACAFFYLLVNPLQEQQDIWIGADTGTYVKYAKVFDDNQDLVTISANYFGPIFLLRLVSYHYELILFINCFILFLSYLLVKNNYKIYELKFVLTLLMNPMLFISLPTVNKEILGLFSIVLFSVYLKNKQFLYLIISIFVAYLVRWQQVVLVLLVLITTGKINPYRNRKILTLSLIVAVISILYPPLISQIIDQIVDFETLSSQQEKAFGLSIILNNLQDKYMFFIAVIPKILINYLGNIIRVFYFPSEIFKIITVNNYIEIENIYNNYIILGHQLSMLIIMFFLGKKFVKNKNKWKLTQINDNIFVCLLYSIVYSLGSAIQYRYFFPIYILFCLEISLKNSYTLNRQ